MSSFQETTEYAENQDWDEMEGNEENSNDVRQNQQKSEDMLQAMLEKAIRDGQTRQVADLVARPEVSLNYRQVTNDLQTPLMRLCHAKLESIPEGNSNPHYEIDGPVVGDHIARSSVVESILASATDGAILTILQAVDRCRLGEHSHFEPIDLEIQDALKRTLAMHACVSQNVAMLSWALARGCSVLAADREGRNVLHYAACSGNDDILHVVVNHADGFKALQTLDFQGYSPVDLARQRRHTGAVKKLVAALRSSDTESSSKPVPAAALPRKEDLVLRPPFPHHKTLTQSNRSHQRNSESVGRTIEPASTHTDRIEMTFHETQVMDTNHHSQPATTARIHSNETLSQHRTLNPISRSSQLNASLSPTQQRSLFEVGNPDLKNKNNIEALRTHNKDKQRVGKQCSALTDFYKTPLASIPVQAENRSDECVAGTETSPKLPATDSSQLQQVDRSPNRTSITPKENRLENSAMRSPPHGLGKLKKSEPISDNFLSPFRSPQQRQKLLKRGDLDSKSNILPAASETIQNQFCTSKLVNKTKTDLLTKRHQPLNSEHDETDTQTPDSSDSCVFEEEFVLDTPERRGSKNESQRPDAADHRADLRRRRDSLSLPDLRDMTGQLVTSREVSPVYTSAASPRPRHDIAWTVGTSGTSRNQGTPELQNHSDEDDSHPSHNKDREHGTQPSNTSKSNHGSNRHQRSTGSRKTQGENYQIDAGSGLPDINTESLKISHLE